MRLFPRFRCSQKDLTQFSGTVQLEANQKDGGDPRIHILAATGKPMRFPHKSPHPVILDVASAKFARNVTPIIEEHDTRIRIGQTISQSVNPSDHTITATAAITGSSQQAKEVASDLQKGFPFQASIGADPEFVHVPEGKSAVVNGTQYNGPFVIAKNAVIREISLAVLGADSDTATMPASTSFQGDTEMMFEEFVKSLGLDPATLTADQKAKLTAHYQTTLKASGTTGTGTNTGTATGTGTTTTTQASATTPPPVPATSLNATADNDLEAARKRIRDLHAQEEARASALTACFSRYADLKTVTWDGKPVSMIEFRASAHRDGYDLRDVELALLKSQLNQGPHEMQAVQRGTEQYVSENLALECAIVRSCGHVPACQKNANGKEFGWEKMYPTQVLEASDRLAGQASLHYLMDRVIMEAGLGPYYGSRKSDAFVNLFARAHTALQAQALGTHSLSNILENVAHKSMMASYQAQTTVWQYICATRTLNDFKVHSMYRLDGSGGYRQIGPDGVLPHLHLTDSKKTLQADTYGQRLTIGRRQLRDDDLGALTEASSGLGRNATVCIEEEVMALLLDNRASYVAGSTNAFGITGLTAVELILRNLVDSVGRPILIAPDRVLVGAQHATTAKDLFSSRNLMMAGLASTSAASYSFTENPHVGKYMPLSSPYLNNTSIKKQSNGAAVSANQDSIQWYLFMNPAVLAALYIGFLDGKMTPTVESAELPFDMVGGVQFKIVHDWGIGLGDFNAAAYVTGA